MLSADSSYAFSLLYYENVYASVHVMCAHKSRAATFVGVTLLTLYRLCYDACHCGETVKGFVNWCLADCFSNVQERICKSCREMYFVRPCLLWDDYNEKTIIFLNLLPDKHTNSLFLRLRNSLYFEYQSSAILSGYLSITLRPGPISKIYL